MVALGDIGEPSVEDSTGGASVVVAEGLLAVTVPVGVGSVLRVDSLAVVGPTSLLETEEADSDGTGAGTSGVELSGAGAGVVSPSGTVVVAVVAMVLWTVVVVSDSAGGASEEAVVGAPYGVGVGVVGSG